MLNTATRGLYSTFKLLLDWALFLSERKIVICSLKCTVLPFSLMANFSERGKPNRAFLTCKQYYVNETSVHCDHVRVGHARKFASQKLAVRSTGNVLFPSNFGRRAIMHAQNSS